MHQGDSVNILSHRVRVSYISSVPLEVLPKFGGPQEFALALQRPPVVGDFPSQLPFGPGLEAENTFWLRVVERNLQTPVSSGEAPHLRRAGVPLRFAPKVWFERETNDAPWSLQLPRLEVWLHPYALSSFTSIDVVFDPAMELGDVANVVDANLLELPRVKGPLSSTGVRIDEVNAQALSGFLDLLGAQTPHQTVQYRLCTVIETKPGDMEAMPKSKGSLQVSMHRLSGGDDLLPAPADAFVATWTGSTYDWSPARLFYLLAEGASSLNFQKTSGLGSASTQHRFATMMTGLILAQLNLLRVAPQSSNTFYSEWAKLAAQQLGRLFGPSERFKDWGLIPQALMRRLDATAAVQAVLGTPLKPNENYRVAEWADPKLENK
ncbi:hypothetical protein GCM10011509_10740 [Ornithinimicrobium pekingense]|uniref:Uncharacterized protein n=1 Tax=Ornithinimicrobium pekingense TaxID=384677 RepID=A0ABQ2F5J5_9MICO|nr:hypothetical protein GCM10011509_10740 [Ornithinimicrobium pekingense]